MNAQNVLLKDLKGVGKITLERLNNAGLYTAKDLLLFYPNKYNIYEPMTIEQASLQIGASCLVGTIISRVNYIYYKPKLNAISFNMAVGENKVHVIIFNRQYLLKMLRPNTIVKVYGKYNKYKKEVVASNIWPGQSEGHIETSYKIKDVNAKQIQKLTKYIYENDIQVAEYLPDYCLEKYQFVNINKMAYMLHNPETLVSVYEARRRKKYEEILEFFLQIQYYNNLRAKIKKEPINYDLGRVKELIDSIEFKLTEDQKMVTNQIFKDFKKNVITSRVIQGDVGSGKTIVSLIASFGIVSASGQVVLMAPTEILANQHYNYFKNYLDKFGVKIALLTGATSKKERKELMDDIAYGNVDILIGTHALFYENIPYRNLKLAIIDEQHRFGVDARNNLLADKDIDSLYLSATPIPRTLALTMFSDLDISTIKSQRPNKKPILTKVLNNDQLDNVFDEIEHELQKGHQGYFVVSAIKSDTDFSRFDIDEVKSLLELRFPESKIGYIHGKLNPKEKNLIMNDYLLHKYDIIVSTTVIEVGISVDNASFIIILDSQNFGLATLHQLRGRVGRKDLDGYCYLLTDDTDIERLRALEESNDGFYLAEMDLKLRGPGEYFGKSQSGVADFVFANFGEDFESFKYIKEDAKTLFLLKENDKKVSDYIDNIIDITVDKLN